MLELEVAKDVEVKRVEARDTVAREDGTGIVVRLTCVFHDIDGLGLVDKLPIGDTVKAAIKAADGVADDQPNTTTVAIKRRFRSFEYLFIDAGVQLARFEADVKNTPRVKVVEGVASLTFCVEGTLTTSELGALAAVIGRDGVVLKTEAPVDPQQELGL